MFYVIISSLYCSPISFNAFIENEYYKHVDFRCTLNTGAMVTSLLYYFRRPRCVCLCQSFPVSPLLIKTNVIILQHPNEVSKLFTTTTAQWWYIYISFEQMFEYCIVWIFGGGKPWQVTMVHQMLTMSPDIYKESKQVLLAKNLWWQICFLL